MNTVYCLLILVLTIDLNFISRHRRRRRAWTYAGNLALDTQDASFCSVRRMGRKFDAQKGKFIDVPIVVWFCWRGHSDDATRTR